MKPIFLIFMQVLFFSAAVSAQATKVVFTCPMHKEIQQAKPGDCPKCGMALEKKTIKVAPPKARKPATVTKDSQSSDDVKEMVSEMRDMMQELKTTIAELKGMINELKGTGDQKDTGSIDEHHDHDLIDTDTSKPVTKQYYTCPMHPKIHSDKPGNCPECGMRLVVEKTKSSTTQPPTYTCPMHPEIHSDKPGNCPKCGMKLVKERPTSNINGNTDHENATMDNIRLAKANLGPIKTITSQLPPRTVVYHLYIKDTTVSFGNKPKRAIAVNGQIPMPTLTFTEGDTAEIWVHNELKELTSLHWHGLFLPNKMDGVPYLTQMPIKPGATYLYKFPIVQHGTHWYHSHSGLQEQIGMYGAFIMNKRKEWDIPTLPVVLSEWTDMKPEEVHRSLHAASVCYA